MTLEKLKKRTKILKIVMIVMVAIQFTITIGVCLLSSSRALIAVDVVCLCISAFELGDAIGISRASKHAEKILDELEQDLEQLERVLSPSAFPAFNAETTHILPIEVKAIRPVGENASSEYLNDILASGLGKEAFKYAKISDEPEEFDSFPCRRAYLRVVPYEKNEVEILKHEK